MFQFPTASQLRTDSLDKLAILREIRAIEEEILLAQNRNELAVNITNSPFTFFDLLLPAIPIQKSELYYTAWKTENQFKLENAQMSEVIDYFKNRGYSIMRKLNSVSNKTFYWEIKW